MNASFRFPRTLLLLAGILVILLCLTGLNPLAPNPDEAAIYANFEKQAACWNQQDIDCYMRAYLKSDSIMTLSRGGRTWGYEAIRKSYKTYFPPDKMGKLQFDQMKLKRLSPEYYYVSGRFTLTYSEAEKVRQGWFSVLMQQVGEKWLMVSDHSS